MFDKYYTIRKFPRFHNDNNIGLLEIFGDEMIFIIDFIHKNPGNNRYVWTIVDTEDNKLTVMAGLHFVNQVNYLITFEEWHDPHEEYDWLILEKMKEGA